VKYYCCNIPATTDAHFRTSASTAARQSRSTIALGSFTLAEIMMAAGARAMAAVGGTFNLANNID
jgi:hypothetical protein